MSGTRFLSAGRALLAAALMLGWASVAETAAQGTDSRWLAWLGCWEGESAAQGSMICIVPQTSDVGIEMVSVEDGRVVSRELVRADGQSRESAREGCRGTETARFSEDGRRIYLAAEHDCQGIARQSTTGMLALLSPNEWIDVRSVVVGESPATGVSRYRLAPSDVAAAAGFGDIALERAMAVRTARVAASARIAINDVIDASRNVSHEVVRAWIAERREPFRLEAAELVRMADEGVSPEVIDVVVAVSYPRYFSLGEGAEPSAERRPDPRAIATDAPRVYAGYGGRFFDPFFGFYNYYDPFYRGYYDSYGYGYGGYGYGYGFRPTVVVVEPREPEAGGRVVNGRGYTRSRPTNSSGPSGAPSSSGDSRSSGSSSSGSSEETGSSGSSSSGGGTSTGRTAKPRPPGQ